MGNEPIHVVTYPPALADMAAAVRCPPPGKRPTAADYDACRYHLEAEWTALPQLRVVVTLGTERRRARHGAALPTSIPTCREPAP